MRRATQFLLMAVVFFGLALWSLPWSSAQPQQKKQGSATKDSTAAGSQSDDATQSSGGTDTGGSSATTKKKKKGTSSGSGGNEMPSESGVAPAPTGGGNNDKPNESVTAQPAGNANGVAYGDHVVKPDITLRKAGGGEENPKESVTATPTSGAQASKRKDGAIHSADFKATGGGEENPKESVTPYKDGEDQTMRGVTKPPPPTAEPGGAGKQDKLNSVKSNPLYKDNNMGGTNPLYEGKDKVAAPQGGTGSTGNGGAGITTRKAGMDQNGVAVSDENPKETVTGTDAERKKMPGKMKSGQIMLTRESPIKGEEAPKETVTSGATKSNTNTLCGTTNHFRTCKPGETPTVSGATGGDTGDGSSDATIKRKKSTSSTKDDSVVAPDDDSTGSGTGAEKKGSTESTKKPK